MIRILTANDHAVARRGFVQILLEGFPGGTFSEAANDCEIPQRLSQQKCILLILDLPCPARSVVELLREIHEDHPYLPVLVVSVHSQDQYARRVLTARAAGNVSKETTHAATKNPEHHHEASLTGRSKFRG